MKNFIILDLEWNQSPDGKRCSVAELPFEIIEIGAVKLDETFALVDEFHQLIKPKVYHQMHHAISEVTQMDMQVLRREGKSFPEAMDTFMGWCGGNHVFCTWGSMDLLELQRNLSYYGMHNPFPVPFLYYDVQKLYGLFLEKGRKPSLDAAIEHLNLHEDRPFHRALNDAYYTGKVLGQLEYQLFKPYYSLDYFRVPQKVEEEIYLKFPQYSKMVSIPYTSNEEIIEQNRITEMKCCSCNRALRKKIRWFSTGQKVYYGLAFCSEHGWILGKIRIKKTLDGKVFAIKILKLVDENTAQSVAVRKNELVKKRQLKKNIKKPPN